MKELIEGKEEKELEKLEVSCAAPAVGRNIRENLAHTNNSIHKFTNGPIVFTQISGNILLKNILFKINFFCTSPFPRFLRA